MKLLLDTQIILWAAGRPERLTAQARSLLEDEANMLIFSAASLWEIVIKAGLGRDDFEVEPAMLRRGLIDNGYEELPITSAHALGVTSLPPLHKDPFDRLILAQAAVEGLYLMTADDIVARYTGTIIKV